MQKEMDKKVTLIKKARQESGTADIARVLRVGLGLSKNFRTSDQKSSNGHALVGSKRPHSEM
jgi:hypothetical protein